MRRTDLSLDFPIGRAYRPIGSRRKLCEDCRQRTAIKGLAICRICAHKRERANG